jgi:hypothetical protein
MTRRQRKTAVLVGRAIARDVIAENWDRRWIGLEPQDADRFMAAGLDPDTSEWEVATRVAKQSYRSYLRNYC